MGVGAWDAQMCALTAKDNFMLAMQFNCFSYFEKVMQLMQTKYS